MVEINISNKNIKNKSHFKNINLLCCVKQFLIWLFYKNIMKITKRNHIYKVGDIVRLKSIEDVGAIYKYIKDNDYNSPGDFLFDKPLKICEIISFNNLTGHQRKLKEKLNFFNTTYKVTTSTDSDYPTGIYTIYDFEIENFNIYI